jgi:C-terminal processing protease CtpA/Prc
MLNMDMVGRLKDNKLIISGYNTAKEFDALITKLNKPYEFDLVREGGGFGPSDHASFYAMNIPVMHFYTGLHSDYHRPSDDFDKLDLDGMNRITSLVVDTAVAIANDEGKPQFTKAATEKFKGSGPATKGARPYFGSIPDLGSQVEGYALTGVTKDSPADLGGLKGGDIIINVGGNKIGNLADFDSALRKFKADDTVEVTVKRVNETLKLKVTVGAPK